MMNRLHGLICSSAPWARLVGRTLLPWSLEGIALAGDVLEIGPGYGASTRALLARQENKTLTSLEIDPGLATRLEASGHRVVRGDGAAMPFEAGSFEHVVCFAMLHHVPSVALQDRLFAEAFRVLRPGGTFAGSDSTTSFGLRLLHIRDTMVVVPPETMTRRLEAAGFVDVAIARRRGAFRFRASKPNGRLGPEVARAPAA